MHLKGPNTPTKSKHLRLAKDQGGAREGWGEKKRRETLQLSPIGNLKKGHKAKKTKKVL